MDEVHVFSTEHFENEINERIYREIAEQGEGWYPRVGLSHWAGTDSPPLVRRTLRQRIKRRTVRPIRLAYRELKDRLAHMRAAALDRDCGYHDDDCPYY